MLTKNGRGELTVSFLKDRDNGVARFSLKSKQSNKPTYKKDKKCEYLVVFM